MKAKWPRTLAVLAIGFLLLFPALSRADEDIGAPPQGVSTSDTRIYMLRGLFGIFSLGIDQLAAKLRAQGYQPIIVGWEQWGFVANQIIAANHDGETGHIILIGHSLGSDSTVQIADAVAKKNIPIDLIVTFDITQPLQVPNNVARFVNFYQNNGFGKPAVAAPGFTGQLENIDLTADKTLGHVTIDESARLQALVIGKVYDITFQQTQQVAARRRTVR
jgi:hypothetical protein